MSLGDYLGSTLSRVYAEVGAQLQEAESALRGGLRNAAAKATDPLSPDEGRVRICWLAEQGHHMRSLLISSRLARVFLPRSKGEGCQRPLYDNAITHISA